MTCSNLAKFAPHMGDPAGDPQTSPQHADPHGLGAFLKKTIQENHVDRRVVGWSAGRHVDHPCGGGGKIGYGLLEKSLMHKHYITQIVFEFNS